MRDNAWVWKSNPTSTNANDVLIVRNDIESYLRIDLAAIPLADLETVNLSLTKKYSANTITVTQASEFLSSGGAETTTPWSEQNLTFATKPLDLPGAASLTFTVADGVVTSSLDLTAIVREAHARGAAALTLHLTTTGTIGSDFTSTRGAQAQRPSIDVAYGSDEEVVQDDARVTASRPHANEGATPNLVVGFGYHSYLRLNIADIDAADLSSALLKLRKYNNGATIVATRASENLSAAGAGTTQRWTEGNVTFDTRPLDVAGSPAVTTTVPSGDAAFSLDLTTLVAAAKAEGKTSLTVHLTTTKVDDTSVAGTDIWSTEAPSLANRPFLEVRGASDELPVPAAVSTPFDSYLANGRSAQRVVTIRDASGKYVAVDPASGALHLVTSKSSAESFAVYGYAYTASPYDGLGGAKETTFAFRSLSTDRYLTTQNYDAEPTSYYRKDGESFLVTATAPSVGWHERFALSEFRNAGTVAISSHLTSLRDGSESAKTPVTVGATQASATPGDQRTYPFTFEDVPVGLLEVHAEVSGSEGTVSWLPVAGDTAAAHYAAWIDGASVPVTAGDADTLTATVTGLTTGSHPVRVAYQGAGTVSGTPLTAESELRVFTPPGVSHTQSQLDAVATHVAQQEEPWYSDYLRLKNTVPNELASLDFEATFLAGVGRGSPAGSGNISAWEESSAAAYFSALQWVATGDDAWAAHVVEILNGWSTTLTQIDGRDQILGAGLATQKLINAAEIVRSYDGGYAGYAPEDFAAFQDVLVDVVYPVLQDGGVPMNANGNWDVAAIATLLAIGVVTDNAEIFDDAVAMYQSPFINGSLTNYVSDWGQTAESARDQAHAQLGVGIMGDISVIGENQGVDLWGLQDNKLAKAFSWSAQYNLFSGEGELRAQPIPNIYGRTDVWAYWDQMDQQILSRGQLRPIYETALAHYSTVPGVDVTWIRKAAEAMRPEGFVHFDNLNFSTLTSYNGDPVEKVEPTFQVRTSLSPFYQGSWAEVEAAGTIDPAWRSLSSGVLPAEFVSETRNSYLVVSEDKSLRIGAQQDAAPFFRLVTNDDESYSVQEVTTGRYLSVDHTTTPAAIRATATTVGQEERFELRNFGIGRHYLVHDGLLVALVPEGDTAVLTLSAKPDGRNVDTGAANWLVLTYGEPTTGRELAFEATATPRCVGSKLTLAVSARNTDVADAQLVISTPFGSKTKTLSPGSQSAQTFTTRVASLGAGTITVTSSAEVDGELVTTSREVPFAAKTCG